MATEVKLPELGDGIESGDVLEIFVSVGDVISAGDDIVEMETDKATVPVPTSVGGKVSKISVAEGDTVPIGGVLIEIDAADGAATPEPAAESPAPAASTEPEPEPAAPSSPPASPAPEPAAPPAPPVATPKASTPTVPPPQNIPAAAAAVSTSTEVIPAGPAVRRFAREVGVDLASVSGSGDGGRITREDVMAVVRSANQARTSSATPFRSSRNLGEGDDGCRSTWYIRCRRFWTNFGRADEQDP